MKERIIRQKEGKVVDEKSISKAVIRRLPRYYRYLGELLEEGVERISSNELSSKMHVTASQIRQDLNNFGGFGQQGYGYNVPYLYAEIGKILGLDLTHHIIIIGAGNLGQALANYVKFEKRGFKVVGIFDINPVLKGISIRGNEIRMMFKLQRLLCQKLMRKRLQTFLWRMELKQFGISHIWTWQFRKMSLWKMCICPKA